MTPNAIASANAAAALPAAPVDATASLDRWLLFALGLWLSTVVVEGPLRAMLVLVGLPNLLYARDLLAAGVVALSLLRPLMSGTRMPPGLVLACWLVAFHFCISFLIGGTPFQRLFGLKMFMPVLFGIAVFPAIQRNLALFLRIVAGFFIVSVIGVFANIFVGQWPWEGLKYETAFGTGQTTRQWWMNSGARRLPGFAQASFDAAMVIGLTGVVLMATLRSIGLRLLVAALGFTAIVLTTSKGMVLAFGVALLWLAPTGRSAASLRIGRGIVFVLLLGTCLVPALFMFISVPSNPADIPPILSSLWDRFAWMWPNAYTLIPDGYGALSGAGMGGIGGALEHPDEMLVPNVADSIFVYLYVSFGLPGLLYLAFPVLATARTRAGAVPPDAFVWSGLLIIAYGYGLSINMIEQPFFSAVFGLLQGAAFAALARR